MSATTPVVSQDGGGGPGGARRGGGGAGERFWFHLVLCLLIFAIGSVATLELWRVKVEGDERAVAHARLKLGKELRGQASRVINAQVARVIRLGSMLGRNKAADAGE